MPPCSGERRRNVILEKRQAKDTQKRQLNDAHAKGKRKGRKKVSWG